MVLQFWRIISPAKTTKKINSESLHSLEKALTGYADVKRRFQEACKAANLPSRLASSDAFQQRFYDAPSKKQHPTTNKIKPDSLQAPELPQLATMPCPRGLRSCQLTPQTSAGIPSKSVLECTHKYQLAIQTLNIASKRLAKQIIIGSLSAAAAVLQCSK